MYLSFLFKSILSVKLNELVGVRCLTFFKIHKYNIHFWYYTFIEFIILLYTFLVISFAWYKKYMICLILFNMFSDVLPTFTCASAVGNLWSFCLGVNILRPIPFVCFIRNIPLLKALRINPHGKRTSWRRPQKTSWRPQVVFIWSYM